jgi:hypothetical protein
MHVVVIRVGSPMTCLSYTCIATNTALYISATAFDLLSATLLALGMKNAACGP